MTAHRGSRLLSLYQKLLRAADSPRLSPAHGAAAINALCGYLERACISSSPRLSGLCFDFTTWKDVFDLFVRRSESNKPKPMRQLLLTLMSVRDKTPDSAIREREKLYACSQAVAMVTGNVECSSGKPAFQVLEYLFSRKVMSSLEMMSLISDDQLTQTTQYPLNTGLIEDNSDPSNEDDYDWTPQVRKFILDVLSWVDYPDTAAIVGRVVGLFVESFQSTLGEGGIDRRSGLSICMGRIKQSIREHPERLDPFRNHVLPDLFRLRLDDLIDFFQEMPLDKLSKGDAGKLSAADVDICMLSVEVAEKSGVLPKWGLSTQLYTL